MQQQPDINSAVTAMLPPNMGAYDTDTQTNIIKYLTQLSSMQQKAYSIARNHLGSSFNVVKSNGYIDWKKTQ